VFSAWHVVPKVVSSLLSYEVERRMVRLFVDEAVNTVEDRAKRGNLLRFTRRDGRLTGLPVLGIMYPSVTLAELGDPLHYCSQAPTETRPDINKLLETVEAEIARRLSAIVDDEASDGPPDETWYWAAPILLDWRAYPESNCEWWQIENLAAKWSGEQGSAKSEDSSAWVEHVTHAHEVTAGSDATHKLGRPPKDLARVLAQMAVGGPGAVALRALSRIAGGDAVLTDIQFRLAAATVSWAFRSLFNVPEVTSLLRGLYQHSKLPYWQQVLRYSTAGCLQAVMDEYAHILYESVGLVHRKSSKAGEAVATAMRAAIQLRTASLKVDHIQIDSESTSVELKNDLRLHAHFAQRFGDIHSDSDTKLARKEGVREAFNSPFWPFVLVTTSVGQEGLDFHPYCHAIVHWNLPANPVDLEQREGRVHRYKGHAIRKNLAHDLGQRILENGKPDPWEKMFVAANYAGTSELVPFWIYPESGEAHAYIERYMPFLPLSRDAQRLTSLKGALAVYRMAFGQNRQEDLVTYLLNRLTQEEIGELATRVQINLQP
jgi:hypothetical protein